MAASLQYTEIPERAKIEMGALVDESYIKERIVKFASVPLRDGDAEGDKEVLDEVEFTHHFAEVPGDHETVRYHYVEAGPARGEAIVFLHGIPDSWFQFFHQMAALAKAGYHCVAPDLKGYGQSEKRPGDYRHEGVAEELFALLTQKIGLTKFNLIAHDRGTCQADYLVFHHPEHVLRYGRGEQHLYHFNPVLSPQGDLFMNAPRTGQMDDARRFVPWAYAAVSKLPIPDSEFTRIIQEFSYPDISNAVPRYFNSSSFRAEWLDRRNRLMAGWKCPVMILQGHDSKTQPREFYENARDYIPNAKEVDVVFLPGGHFWTKESPKETTEAIRKMLAMPA